MTNFRPDIHCDGCGKYCYSLSHRPQDWKFPKLHYCEQCKKAVGQGMRSGAMLDRAWYDMAERVQRQLEAVRQLSKQEATTVRSFAWTMRNRSTPKARPFKNNPNKMTVKEWKEIAEKKLKFFRQYCNKEAFTLLHALIEVAH